MVQNVTVVSNWSGVLDYGDSETNWFWRVTLWAMETWMIMRELTKPSSKSWKHWVCEPRQWWHMKPWGLFVSTATIKCHCSRTTTTKWVYQWFFPPLPVSTQSLPHNQSSVYLYHVQIVNCWLAPTLILPLNSSQDRYFFLCSRLKLANW